MSKSLINVWDLPEYGFNRKHLEHIVYSGKPEFAWFQKCLVYREGYKKPKMHFERFLELYREYVLEKMQHEIAAMTLEIQRKYDSLSKEAEEAYHAYTNTWLPREEPIDDDSNEPYRVTSFSEEDD